MSDESIHFLFDVGYIIFVRHKIVNNLAETTYFYLSIENIL